MMLTREDQVAIRAGEHASLRTSAQGRPTPRRVVVLGARTDPGLDPDRIDALADAGYLVDIEDRDADPARGRRRLTATELGRREWRCAMAEDPALAMRMDDVFHAPGAIVAVDVKDVRYHEAAAAQPDLSAPEWEIETQPADPELEIGEMIVYRRTVRVEAIANHLGELLTAWNPTPREPVMGGRLPAHSTGARFTMSAWILVALDAAVNHRLYYRGGHTHYETRCGTRGGSASSDARNLLLRFGLIRARVPDERTRREDFEATPRGVRFHALATRHLADLNERDAAEWSRYAERVALAAAA